MQKFGGVATRMQQNSISVEERKTLEQIIYLVGNAQLIEEMKSVAPKRPFDDSVIEFLNVLSKELMSDKEAKQYPDVITLGFWLRKASISKMKSRFLHEDGNIYLGRGVVFHIAPSNVPVNYAYSLVTGLLTGNANIVRIPSKDFPQVSIINNAIKRALKVHETIIPYICLVKYERNIEINNILSGIADVRVVWGGDATIAEIRKSSLRPRASEITFADRYSIAVIDSDRYLEKENKGKVAEDFYNDTYLTDQNACTSPRIVIWTGCNKEEAKNIFWTELHEKVAAKYTFQSIQGVNKLTSSYLIAATSDGVKVIEQADNLITRVEIKEVFANIMDLKDNSGYFFEYDCDDISELRNLCNNTHCQTISYIGDNKMFTHLLESGIRGVDRIVPMGKTMDFDLIWDGYNLVERMTRVIRNAYLYS